MVLGWRRYNLIKRATPARNDVLSIVLVHCGGYAICNQAMNSVSDLWIDLPDYRLLFRGEIAEDIFDGI